MKETIDRLRFDLDELRAVGRKSLYVDSTDSSTGGSVSRSLGGELARKLAETEMQDALEDDDEGSESEEEEDIVVTTHRRIVSRAPLHRFRDPGLTLPLNQRKRTKTATQDQPMVTHERTVLVVLDADTQTEPIGTPARIVEVTPPPSVPAKTPREVQEELAQGLGMEWSKLVDLVEGEKDKDKQEKKVASSNFLNESRRAGRWAARISSRLPLTAAAQAPAYFINVRLFLILNDSRARILLTPFSRKLNPLGFP